MIRLYTFLIFGAIGIVFLYAIFVVPRPEFVGKTSLVFVAENVTTATNLDYTINDIVYISQNTAQNNIEVKKYDADVKIERLKQHNIVELSILADSMEHVDITKYSVIKDMTKYIKKHYALNKDLTITIIANESVQQTSVSLIAPYVVMIAVAIGVISGVLALFAIFGKKTNDEYEENIDGKKIFAHYNANIFSSEIKKDINSNNDKGGEEVSENADISIESNDEIEDVNESLDDKDAILIEDEEAKENSTTQIVNEEILEDEDFLGKTPHVEGGHPQEEIKNDMQVNKLNAPAGLQTTPGNLPVINLEEIGFADNTQKNEDNCDDLNGKTEPTEEELKARLNELLNGKL